MRIISGTFRGKKIQAPAGLPVRPTTDYAKTGLFNIIASRYRFSQLSVADLFSGTGSLTYEFFSRGTTVLTAVDRAPGCVRFIKETLKSLQAPDKVVAIQSDVLSWLETCADSFDIIVADPPFAETPASEIVDIVSNRKLLRRDGILIIEHAGDRDLSGLPGFAESRKYGNVRFSFFKPVE